MKLYKIEFNDFGIAYCAALTTLGALTDFEIWYKHKHDDKDCKIRSITLVVGDYIE